MIIIPIFNVGSERYGSLSKFFLKIRNQFAIQYCLDCIERTDNEQLLFLVSEVDCANFKVDKILSQLYPDCMTYQVHDSHSVIDTLYQARTLIPNSERIVVFAPPFTYFEPRLTLAEIEDYADAEVYLLVTKTNNPHYCYANIKDRNVMAVKEKKIISSHGLTGIYCFRNKAVLYSHIPAFMQQIAAGDKLYLSDVLQQVIACGGSIISRETELTYPFTDHKNITYLKQHVRWNEIIIGLSCDHSGYRGKGQMIQCLDHMGIKYVDYGCYTRDDCDFQDYITNQAIGYKNNEFNFGLSFCRSGQGVNIAANHSGFSSAVIYDKWSAQMAIQHNNCNFFCLSERLMDSGIYTPSEIMHIILDQRFLGGRFLDRLTKTKNLKSQLHQ